MKPRVTYRVTSWEVVVTAPGLRYITIHNYIRFCRHEQVAVSSYRFLQEESTCRKLGVDLRRRPTMRMCVVAAVLLLCLALNSWSAVMSCTCQRTPFRTAVNVFNRYKQSCHFVSMFQSWCCKFCDGEGVRLYGSTQIPFVSDFSSCNAARFKQYLQFLLATIIPETRFCIVSVLPLVQVRHECRIAP